MKLWPTYDYLLNIIHEWSKPKAWYVTSAHALIYLFKKKMFYLYICLSFFCRFQSFFLRLVNDFLWCKRAPKQSIFNHSKEFLIVLLCVFSYFFFASCKIVHPKPFKAVDLKSRLIVFLVFFTYTQLRDLIASIISRVPTETTFFLSAFFVRSMNVCHWIQQRQW